MLCPHNSDPIRWCKDCAVAEKLGQLERIRRWPNTLANVECGFHCPPGWLAPVERLTELLERIGGVQCVQVKEKFGGLRYYVHTDPRPHPQHEFIHALIHACEAACDSLCLYCGGPGTLRRGGWWRTLCESCDADYMKGNR